MKQFIIIIVMSIIGSFLGYLAGLIHNNGWDKGYINGYNDGICLMVFKMMPDKSSCSAEETNSGTLIFVK